MATLRKQDDMTHITVSVLIERLQDCDPGALVLLATQPSWPLQTMLRGIATTEDIAGETECDSHGNYDCDDCRSGVADRSVVYLVEGSHPDDLGLSPYAPRAAWEVAR